MTEAEAGRLFFDGDRCVGVEYRVKDGKRVSLARAAEVILATGAVGSAQQLMLSGIGANLQDHAW